MPYAIGASGIAVVDEKIYLIGGASNLNNSPVATVYAYDPISEVWTQKANLHTPRVYLSACAINGKIYAIGGTTQNYEVEFYKHVEEYNPLDNTWTQKADMPTGRWGLFTCDVDGLIYAIGGRGGQAGESCTINEVYNPLTDTWVVKAPMNTERITPAAGVINNKIYVTGGHGGPPIDYLSSTEEYTPDISDSDLELNLRPNDFLLYQNYPNPFNPTTAIRYQIPELSFVTFKVYDVLGNEVVILVNEEKPTGSYEVEFDATALSSGIYFYRLQAGDFIETKKMVLMK
jgi:N-acetylneuraminic acid mutarotase